VLGFRDELEGVVEVFCKVLREEEKRVACGQEQEQEQEPRFDLGVGALGDGDGDEEGEWDIDQHIERLSLDGNQQNLMRLSDRMR
jgi:hypothetical protein